MVVFQFHLKNQCLATSYKDSEPQNAPNVCFKHVCDRKCVKPMVLLLVDIMAMLYKDSGRFVNPLVNPFVNPFVRYICQIQMSFYFRGGGSSK